jgi:hydrogenase maturation protease
MSDTRRTLIIGIGSDFGDDWLGPFVINKLSARFPSCEVRRLRSPLDLLDYLDDIERLHVVDACRGPGPPGTIIHRDWPSPDLDCVQFSGTHDFGLIATLQLAERLQRLPLHVTIWGVDAAEEESYSLAVRSLSPVVAAAAEVLVKRIAAEVANEKESVEEANRYA